MVVVFLTNFLTHHQTALCNELYARLGKDFSLVVTQPMSAEQKHLGYQELNELYPYVIRTYEAEKVEQRVMTLCLEADVVILGSAPLKYIRQRRKANKLTFLYLERLFKRGVIHSLTPYAIRGLYKMYTSQRRKNQYYLCASAYAPADINLCTRTPDKFFRWGYFPENKEYPDIDALIEDKVQNEIVWVGRFIPLKHPEMAVFLAKRLKAEGYQFHMTMLGNGIMLDQIKELVQQEQLTDIVRIIGAVPSDAVRSYMEKAQIHIFTSDRNEGWGAVVNEAMNSGCVVVANQAVGSVPFLIQNGENGYAYCDAEDFYFKVKSLLDDPKKRVKMSKSAYKTIAGQWNGKNAAQRLLLLSEQLLYGEKAPDLWENGPCSRAPLQPAGRSASKKQEV